MFRSLTVISLLSTAVFAQSSSGTATSTASSLIPSGISSGCSSYLQSLNSNSTIEQCVTPIVKASSAYAPGSSSTPSQSDLASICSTSICDDSLIRSALSSFYSACTAELTSSKNDQVATLYDVMYVLSPMKTALCSKSDSGSYCALSATSASSAAAASSTAASAADAASQAQQYLATSSGSLNATAFSATNLPFMFLQSTLTSAQCTTCTRNVLTSYINWESNSPYAPGLSSSVLLGTQNTLYSAVTSTCGSNFLSGVVKAAGGLGQGSGSSNGSFRSFTFDIRTIGAALVAMLVVFAL